MADEQDLFTQIDGPQDAPETPVAPEVPALEAVAPEVPETPEAVADPAPVAAAVPEPERSAERSVPLAVLIEERKSHREETAALRAEVAKLTESLGKPSDKPTAEESSDPDYLDDPKGYMDARISKALARLETLEKTGGERLEQIERSTKEVALDRQLSSAHEAFVAKTPDFSAALDHVRQARAGQLKLAYPDASEQQIISQILNEERSAAAQLLAAGRNPIEYVYGIAKTIGYTPKQAPVPAINGAAKAAVVPADVTLGRTPGGPPESDPGEDEGEPDILAAAQAERFGRKRA